MELAEHLFRREAGRLVAILTRLFGIHNLALAEDVAQELTRLLESEWTLAPVVDESFGPAAMKDVQLRMMFSCIHPRLPEEAQVALVLHLLCGFSVGETAAAFLKERAAMQKRIGRGW